MKNISSSRLNSWQKHVFKKVKKTQLEEDDATNQVNQEQLSNMTGIKKSTSERQSLSEEQF